MKLFAIYLKTNNLSLKISLKNIDKSTKKIDKTKFYYICRDSHLLIY